MVLRRSVSFSFSLLVMLLVDVRVFGLGDVGSIDALRASITAAPDYEHVLILNALVGVSVVLLVLELRGDALRVVLTVGVALVFGYLMTAFFNLDSARRFFHILCDYVDIYLDRLKIEIDQHLI